MNKEIKIIAYSASYYITGTQGALKDGILTVNVKEGYYYKKSGDVESSKKKLNENSTLQLPIAQIEAIETYTTA